MLIYVNLDVAKLLWRAIHGNAPASIDPEGTTPLGGCLAGGAGAGIISGVFNVWNYFSGKKSGCEAIADTLCSALAGCIVGGIAGSGLPVFKCIGIASLTGLFVAGCQYISRKICDWIRSNPGDCPKDEVSDACMATSMVGMIGTSVLACMGGKAKETLISFMLGVDYAAIDNISC